MVVRIQLRHDSAANWTTYNPILLSGEVGVETDTFKMKIGTGQRWANTSYYDANFVHTSGEETIGGAKSFTDKMTVGNTTSATTSDTMFDLKNSANIDGNVVIDGTLDVADTATFTKKIEGIVDKAYKDEDGNTIKTYYQQLLANANGIVDNTDWNDANYCVEGVFNVNVTAWSPIECHDPSEYNANIGKQGILITHVDKNSNVIQRYIPIGSDSSTDYTIVTRYKTTAWSSWKSQNSGDSNLVHTVNNEVINGNKEFTQELYSSNGKIYLSTNLSNTDTGYDAIIARKGSGTGFDNIINRKGSGELYLSGTNGISLRPYGENDKLICTQTTGTSLSNISGDVDIFKTKYSTSGTYLFTYNGTDWTVNSVAITISDYGITFAGTPELGDVITAVYTEAIKIDISTDGIIDGKCTKDGIGNVINTTYAVKNEVNGLFIKTPEFKDSSIDVEAYRDVRKRYINSFGTYVDIIKKNNYTITGTITIGTDAECGVASGFSATDYISIPALTGTTEELYLQGIFITGTDLTGTQCIYYGDTDNYMNLVFGTDDTQTLEAKVAGIEYSYTFNTAVTAETGYTYEIMLSDTLSNLYINDQLATTGETLSSTVSLANIATQIGSDGTNYFKGYIDLNAFRISKVIPVEKSGYLELDVYEAPVYQPCLQIPYTLSKYGVKIATMDYADRIEDCFNQFQTANYFVIYVPTSESEHGMYRLPYDSPNGLNHTIYHWRDNNGNECEYDTNLECIQTGACTSGTAITFNKEFADNNYSLIGVTSSSKSESGFTPSETGYYIARGRITLG